MYRWALVTLTVATVATYWNQLTVSISGPRVTIQNGTLIGRTDSQIDHFVGVPYAQPPVGQLRLKPPSPIRTHYGTFQLPSVVPMCTQALAERFELPKMPNETAQVMQAVISSLPGPQSEDCLTLTISRPTKTKPGDELPVVFWIHGGGFQVGSTALYNGSVMVEQAVAMGKPMIHVGVNYRLGAFGFLVGKEVQEDGSTNLGLRDQRQALYWVADNIAAFGGSPDKVVLWGHSAGGMSAYSHLLVNNGDSNYNNRPLFRGAIISSGTLSPTVATNDQKPQLIYDAVARSAGCPNASDSLACLRAVPHSKFQEAANSLPPFLRFQYMAQPYTIRPDPRDGFLTHSVDRSAASGRVARVPVIFTNQEDEGTAFALLNRHLTTTESATEYLQTMFPKAKSGDVAGLLSMYAGDADTGSPFHTGVESEYFPQYKRLAAIVGDIFFTLRRRQVLEQLGNSASKWSSLHGFRHQFPLLGSFHLSDILQMYTLVPNKTLGQQLNSYYINFINDLAPDGEGLPHWPEWTSEKKNLLKIGQANANVVVDDFRDSILRYMQDKGSAFAV